MDACRSRRSRSCSRVILLLALTPACREDRQESLPTHAAPPLGSDSLVAKRGDSLEIWFTLSRVGHAANGTTCVERGIEIRRDETRTPVPLLYTGAPPVILNDSTLRAELWNQCRPVATYRVDLRTGRPVREGG